MRAILFLAIGIIGVSAVSEQTHDDPLKPLLFETVSLQDSFWLPRLKTLTRVTIPFALEKTVPAVENLRRCADYLADRDGDKPFTHRFVSSDLYKVMEGAAYSLMISPDPALERQLDEIIDIIAEAQQDDGYLYVSHICGVANPQEMGDTPYSWVVHSHELYNMGHMYEGAVAYYRATGKDRWLQVAEKSARHVNRVIFEGGDPDYNGGKPILQAPGHEEPELALCQLYRVTGERLYLDMAKQFLDIRGVTYRPEGEGVMSPTYAQQHKPVREQERAVGHAVRAAYLYAGMADVSALTGDPTLGEAVDRIWRNIVDTKMHITGGLGAVHGTEGFGPEFELPNRDAYNETCAAIANVLFNYRQFLLHQDARYFDVAEIALFNNTLAGIGMGGDTFFYVNPLEADGIRMFNHGKKGRSPWFDCACCPSNLARLLPQVPGYMYAHTDSDIYLTLYGSSRTEVPMPEGTVTLNQDSSYPFDGRVVVDIGLAGTQVFALKLRIPTWAQGRQYVPGALYRYLDPVEVPWTVTVNGTSVVPNLHQGFATLERMWNPGDQVVLELPMPVRYNLCATEVEANRDRIAVTRGPLVYCAEEADNPDRPVQHFFLPEPGAAGETTTETIEDGPLAGVVRISVPGREVVKETSRAAFIRMVPYYAWNNRGAASMVVWMPQSDALARESMKSNLLTTTGFGTVLASHTYDHDTVAALMDGHVPASSSDQGGPRWTSRPFENRQQDITISFDEPRDVGRISVYWYEEPGPISEVQLPREWWVDYKVGDGEWRRMNRYITDEYGLQRDTFNQVRPDARMTCDAIRISVLPQVGHCMGIHQIEVVH